MPAPPSCQWRKGELYCPSCTLAMGSLHLCPLCARLGTPSYHPAPVPAVCWAGHTLISSLFLPDTASLAPFSHGETLGGWSPSHSEVVPDEDLPETRPLTTCPTSCHFLMLSPLSSRSAISITHTLFSMERKLSVFLCLQ